MEESSQMTPAFNAPVKALVSGIHLPNSRGSRVTVPLGTIAKGGESVGSIFQNGQTSPGTLAPAGSLLIGNTIALDATQGIRGIALAVCAGRTAWRPDEKDCLPLGATAYSYCTPEVNLKGPFCNSADGTKPEMRFKSIWGQFNPHRICDSGHCPLARKNPDKTTGTTALTLEEYDPVTTNKTNRKLDVLKGVLFKCTYHIDIYFLFEGWSVEPVLLQFGGSRYFTGRDLSRKIISVGDPVWQNTFTLKTTMTSKGKNRWWVWDEPQHEYTHVSGEAKEVLERIYERVNTYILPERMKDAEAPPFNRQEDEHAPSPEEDEPVSLAGPEDVPPVALDDVPF